MGYRLKAELDVMSRDEAQAIVRAILEAHGPDLVLDTDGQRELKESVAVGADTGADPVEGFDPTIRQQYNRAAQNFRASGYFATKIKDIELAYGVELACGTEPNSELFAEVTWLFSASIMHAVACMEAVYNDLVEDSDFGRERLGKIEGKPLLSRCNSLLEYHSKPTFEQGSKTAQAASNVVSLRNALVHYQPEWGDQAGESARLEKQLPRGMESLLATEDARFFPVSCASYSCAEWAGASVREFVSDACARFDHKLEWL
ncbi:hypothetical protein [Parasedimentitalea psychrophila]|uniref:Uncharacterized protein n=1 Tax=Parasedimentitalea psychrophila TaxID=2997337 RepID=A0A9Y2KYT9_9RHOB|nr:hypothetical protein [Parasedimentitalea psychrophila]WIY24805.1 hypothetical protein QPJ95_20245 [Parasedimentitalea psychrophila]